MADFQFDTSGEVECVDVAANNPAEYAWRWSDLDAFTQGYIEALFASARLNRPTKRRKFENSDLQTSYDWYLSNQPDPEAHKTRGSAGNAYYVGRTFACRDRPFAQPGSIAYATWAAGVDLHDGKPLGYSSLAGETLAAILKDCERFLAPYAGNRLMRNDAAAGKRFWLERQTAEEFSGFPPQTPEIRSDGRVYLRGAL